ncbi:MAG: PQQ-binding-like beta-propeller repeat protein [Chlamydiota bacterium]
MRKTASYLSLLFFVLFFSFYHSDLSAKSFGPKKHWQEQLGVRAMGIDVDKIEIFDQVTQKTIEQERVYFGGSNGVLYCYELEGETLRLVWEYQAPAAIIGVEVDKDHRIYFSSTYESLEGASEAPKGRLFCLNKDGEEQWTVPLNKQVWRVITNKKDQIYCVLHQPKENSKDHCKGEGYVVCFKPTGDKQWEKKMPGAVYGCDTYDDKGIFFGTYTGDVYHLGILGDLEAKYSLTENKIKGLKVEISRGLLESWNRFYCGSEDGNLYCFDFEKKKKEWVAPVGDTVRAVSLDRSQHYVYVSADDGHIYVYSGYSGNKVGTFYHGDKVYSMAVSDGRVYYSTEDSFFLISDLVEK